MGISGYLLLCEIGYNGCYVVHSIIVGDRIAQLILEQISMAPAVKVWELNDTKRGIAGFGSTGVCALEGEGTSGPGHFGYASTL